MMSQLRVYVINRGKMDEFVTAWKQGIYPLRLRHGFAIPHAWINRERNEFVWLLSYDGPDSWEDREAAYYASPERLTLDPDPAQFVAQANIASVDPVPLPR